MTRGTATPRKKTIAIGHGKGGAALANALASRTDLGLSRIVLLGTDTIPAARPNAFTKVPAWTQAAGGTKVPLVFVRGAKDALTSLPSLLAFKRKHPNSTVLPDVAGVNHFCIVDGNPNDPKNGAVGLPSERFQDGDATPLTVQTCVSRMVSAIATYLP
jgi:pimeloyl-ACP methyl ester carboxylesterase